MRDNFNAGFHGSQTKRPARFPVRQDDKICKFASQGMTAKSSPTRFVATSAHRHLDYWPLKVIFDVSGASAFK